MNKKIHMIIIVVLLIVFVVSAFMVGNYIVQSRQQAKAAAELAALKESAKENASQSETTEATEETVPEGTFGAAEDIRDENEMLTEYSQIYAQNNDVVGWIRIDGTLLDYPVMQTPDNPNFYLKHDFNGNDSDWGAIYAREECDINRPSDNITLYGHNMRDGSMFAALNAYTEKEAWENNPMIFFDTLYDYHTYKIFAVFKTEASMDKGFKYHNMIEAENKEAFDAFVSNCKQLSFYETNETPQYGDKIICLSTCEYTLENGRLVVAAYRIS